MSDDGFVKKATAWALGTKPVRAILLYQEHHGPMLADSVTYRVLFSVFAGVFLGFAIAGLWLAGNDGAMNALIAAVNSTIPGLIGEGNLIDPADLVQPLTFGIAGILALVGLVGTAIGAIGSLQTAFRNIADQPNDPTFFLWILLRNLVLAIGFGAALLAAAAVTYFSTAALETVFSWAGASWLTDAAARAISILVIFAIDTLVVAVMFRLLSGLRPDARSLWSGAILGGVGLTVLQVLSSLFVGGAGSNPLLASFGSIIALLLWLNFSSQVILIAGAYIVTGVEEKQNRLRVRYGAGTFETRRVQRAENAVEAAASELEVAREAARKAAAPKPPKGKKKSKKDEKAPASVS
ncbi:MULTISPECIES: YihY/virulence factor BrkB family protein [unclassified Leifsonia]|uniref:YihY/virulence factor BrkB family protein n=1 Tax=unclassified Leifsonia TaxID=2663824 RepID=UPI0007002C71|nr:MULTISPECIES: YihY/virulence factor BrkB family protein [unclassified Leifsonia]KQX06591.1 ribonuclease BN [Leifsonia sp. Root1293]KRA10875.1 ribonuclease BN [Leifsonia sp. Root60]